MVDCEVTGYALAGVTSGSTILVSPRVGRVVTEPTELAASPDGASEALAAASVADVVVGREVGGPQQGVHPK